MSPVVDFFQPASRQVGVYLGGGEVLVPEHFLDASQVGSCVEHVCRKAVPQRVRADMRVDTGHGKILVELAADGSVGKPLSGTIDEQRAFPGCVLGQIVSHVQVEVDGLDCLGPEWR